MSERDYSASVLISLPKLSASRALTLLTSLLTAASEESARLSASGQTLPAMIERARTRLASFTETLRLSLVPVSSTSSDSPRKADTALDRAWSAMRDLVTAWKKLPEPFNPFTAEVGALDALLFRDGLTFTLLDYVEEWQASQSRLDALTAQGLETSLARLGGLPFLHSLLKAHSDYGAALGITAAVVPEQSSQLNAALLPALDGLRDYTAKVSAWVDPDEPGSLELYQTLLRPLLEWPQ